MEINKNQFLVLVKEFAKARLVTRTELISAYDEGSGVVRGEDRHFAISKILYYIGGAIVFIGIFILVGQHWQELSPVTRIVVTFGSGIAAYAAAVFLLNDERFFGVANAFFLISALLMPLGLNIVFDNAGYHTFISGVQSSISAILLAVYLVSFFVFKKDLFIVFSAIFGTWLFYVFTSFIVGNAVGVESYFKFTEYRTLVVGFGYLLLGYFFSGTSRRALTNPFYIFGLLGFLGAMIALGGWSPNQNVFWELVFPGFVFGVIFLSVYLKSRAFLFLGALYLMGYIMKITAEYFTRDLGWPLSLVVAGFGLMAIGYFAFYLNRRYFGTRSAA